MLSLIIRWVNVQFPRLTKVEKLALIGKLSDRANEDIEYWQEQSFWKLYDSIN